MASFEEAELFELEKVFNKELPTSITGFDEQHIPYPNGVASAIHFRKYVQEHSGLILHEATEVVGTDPFRWLGQVAVRYMSRPTCDAKGRENGIQARIIAFRVLEDEDFYSFAGYEATITDDRVAMTPWLNAFKVLPR